MALLSPPIALDSLAKDYTIAAVIYPIDNYLAELI
jgi:hypothetical protein